MLVEYINPFVEASTFVFEKVAGIKMRRGTAYQKTSGFDSGKVSIIIGVVGKLEGQIIFTMGEQTAMYAASLMMGGTPLEKFSEMAKSAVAEMANIISGNTMTIFSKKELKMKISPPALITGNSVNISVTKNTVIAIPLIFPNGLSFEINVVLS